MGMKKNPAFKYTKIEIPDQGIKNTIRAWCRDHFGECITPTCRYVWYCTYGKKETFHSAKRGSVLSTWYSSDPTLRFYFRDPCHATMFALRWS